jgi:hypothetical protein
MRTNVSLTSKISRRRARFDHDAIDDGHAKHGLQMRNHAAWLSLTTPILTASGEDQDEAQHIHDILDEKKKTNAAFASVVEGMVAARSFLAEQAKPSESAAPLS